MSRIEYPRILIVTSNSFNLFTGGGICHTNLFRGWPKTHIANIHNDPMKSDASVCDNFYCLTNQDIQWMAPFNYLRSLIHHSQSSIAPKDHRLAAKNNFSFKIKKFINSGLEFLLGTNLREDIILSQSLKLWIDDFKPDIIYTTLGDLTFLKLSKLIRDSYRIPVVVHMMDDWPDSKYRWGILACLLRNKMKKVLKDIFNQSVLNLGMSREMCRVYQNRYGVDFHLCTDGVDVGIWRHHQKKRLVRSKWLPCDLYGDSR